MKNGKDCDCPFCGQNFTPENGMTLKEHLAKGILTVYGEIQHFTHKRETPCPRCGNKRMENSLTENALSRYFNIYICRECVENEAARECKNDVLPLTVWNIANEILSYIPGIQCKGHIPEKGSAYPLCDNRECEDSKKCSISAHF